MHKPLIETLQATIKEATGRKPPKPSLLAMSEKRDPFNFGKPGDWEKAHWLVDVWKKVASDLFQVHNRILHYRIISQSSKILKPDGMEQMWNQKHGYRRVLFPPQ